MATKTLAENVTQAISDFDDIKTAIEAKGVTVPSGTPTSDYDSLIGDIPTGDDSALIDLIEGDIVTLTVPSGVTKIKKYLCSYNTSLQSVVIPEGVTSIENYAFLSCSSLSSAVLPNSLTRLFDNAFGSCSNLQNVNLGSNLTAIDSQAFYGCQHLTSVTLPASLSSVGSRAFMYCSALSTLEIQRAAGWFGDYAFNFCTALENVTLVSGFNTNNLNLSASTLYSAQTIVSWLNALADRTGQTAYTLTIGSTNLAKLTAEEIAIATNKNWNLA